MRRRRRHTAASTVREGGPGVRHPAHVCWQAVCKFVQPTVVSWSVDPTPFPSVPPQAVAVITRFVSQC